MHRSYLMYVVKLSNMICQECGLEKGCGCEFFKIKQRKYKVCPDCKKKLDKIDPNNNEQQNLQPNVQGV